MRAIFGAKTTTKAWRKWNKDLLYVYKGFSDQCGFQGGESTYFNRKPL